jgi:hypothetical protein
MRRHKNQIAYPRKKIIAILRTLNEFVVSLDQIGSASYDVTKEEHDALLADFIQRHKIFQKMAQARRILSAPFSTKLGTDEMDELEREMEGILYWNDKQKVMSLKKGKR